MTDFVKEFVALVENTAAETGRYLSANVREAGEYARARAVHLATVAHEPGFEMALRAERDNVALMLGISTVGAADAADQRLMGVILGVLGMGARIL